MAGGKTEDRHDQASGLDERPPVDVLKVLADGQKAAAAVVDAPAPPWQPSTGTTGSVGSQSGTVDARGASSRKSPRAAAR